MFNKSSQITRVRHPKSYDCITIRCHKKKGNQSQTAEVRNKQLDSEEENKDHTQTSYLDIF